MSCRIECHTEQYFSREREIARSVAPGGTAPSMVKCSSIWTKRCGSSCARWATRCARSARNGWRPFVRRCTMSADMQPANANASVCTGEGPFLLSPSIVIALFALLDEPANCSPPVQARSTTVGGFDAT